MKNLKLFVVAAVATVAFASCGGGAKDGASDSLKTDSAKVAPVEDTTKTVTPEDTTKTADTVKTK